VFNLYLWLKYLLLAISLLLLSGCTASGLLMGGVATSVLVNEPRAVANIVKDQTLRHEIDKCIAREMPEDSNIKSHTYNRVVLLTGQVMDEELQQEIENYASSLPRTKRVFNQIRLQPPLSPWQRIKDTVLTSYIRIKLLLAGGVRSTRFRITTDNQHVFILGRAKEEQAKLVTQVVQHTQGVKQVIRVVEPI